MFLSITATFIDWKWRFTKHFSSCFGKKTCPYCVIRFSSKSLNKLLYTRPGWINCKKIWCEALFLVFLFSGPFGQKIEFNANVFFIINSHNFGILNVNRIWWKYVVLRLYLQVNSKTCLFHYIKCHVNVEKQFFVKILTKNENFRTHVFLHDSFKNNF